MIPRLKEDMRDNPILLREWRRFGRSWWGWLLLILVGWFPMSLVLRLAWNQGLGFTAIWQQFILQVLSIGLRADVLLGFFLVYRISTEKNWLSMKQEIMATRLTPRQIMYGKAFVPIIVLVILNFLSAFYFYGKLYNDPEFQLALPSAGTEWTLEGIIDENYIGFRNEQDFRDYLYFEDQTTSGTVVSTNPQAAPVNTAPANSRVFPLAIPIGLLGLLEDFLFAVLLILIAMDEYFFKQNALLATGESLVRVSLVGVLLFGASLAPLPLMDQMPYSWQDSLLFAPPVYTAFSNIIWFALALPIELILIILMIRTLNKRFAGWLTEED